MILNKIKKNIFFVVIFFVLSMIFLLHYWIVGQAVYGDGIYYFAYTRSIVKDRDINFLNELKHHYSPKNNNSLQYDSYEIVQSRTKTGMVPNKYPVGAPLLWLPAFLIIDLSANSINFFNPNFPNNGYSDTYQVGIGILNVFFVLLGLIFLHKFLTIYFSKLISYISVLTILFGSNLLYYGSVDVINSHPSSFLFSVLFLTIWWKSIQNRTIKQWFLIGLIIGALTAIRTQDILFVSIIIMEILLKTTKAVVTRKLYKIKNLSIGLAISSIGAVIVFLPQLIVWKTLYGNLFVSPYVSGGEGFNFLNPQIIGLLLNYKSGLFIWTPIYLFFIIGLYFFRKINKTLTIFSISFFALQFYLVSSWSGWEQGESFGNRMLISTLPFLSLGLGAFMLRLRKKFGKKSLIHISSLIITYNFIAIFYFLIFSQTTTFDRIYNTQIEALKRIEKIIHVKLY